MLHNIEGWGFCENSLSRINTKLAGIMPPYKCDARFERQLNIIPVMPNSLFSLHVYN